MAGEEAEAGGGGPSRSQGINSRGREGKEKSNVI